VAAAATPGRAALRAGLVDESGAWLPANSPAGRALPAPPVLASVKLARPQPLAGRPSIEVAAAFGDSIRLLGYDLTRQGDQLRLVLFWEGSARPAGDATRFVHLLDAGGRLVAQADGAPQNGFYPTSIWDAGERVRDEVVLDVPPGVAGELRLAVGFYDPASLERLPVTAGDGLRPDGLFVLPERIQVAR
jgi:hypothetical protein